MNPSKSRVRLHDPLGVHPKQLTCTMVWPFSFYYLKKWLNLNNVHTRCIVKTSGFTRGVCKNPGFIKFKGFLVEFLESRRSWENQKPPENRQKSGLFWASPFTMHLVCTLLIKRTWENNLKFVKKCAKCEKVWQSAETILPCSSCPLVFVWREQ